MAKRRNPVDLPPSKWGTARICVNSWFMFSSALSTSLRSISVLVLADFLDVRIRAAPGGRRRDAPDAATAASGAAGLLLQLQNLFLPVAAQDHSVPLDRFDRAAAGDLVADAIEVLLARVQSSMMRRTLPSLVDGDAPQLAAAAASAAALAPPSAAGLRRVEDVALVDHRVIGVRLGSPPAESAAAAH